MGEEVKVFFRKRPFHTCDINDKDILSMDKNIMVLDDNRPRIKQEVTQKKFRKHKNIVFIPDTTSNNELYGNYFQDDIDTFLTSKSNGLLLLAYGQTGSGKTHTIMGTNDQPGLLISYFKHLFKIIGDNTNILLSCFEIYNENVSDLINHKTKLKQWFSILDHKNCYSISNLQDLDKYVNIINKNKVMGASKINKNSSRSHTIYKIDVNGKSIIFIDLAGNERGRVSVANNRLAIQEASNINLSLFSLKECIRALRERHKYIPFRGSKLTIVLRDIFQKGFNIRFIAALNPSVHQFHDTLDTIRYAISLSYSNLKQIELFEDDKPKKSVKDPLHRLHPVPNNLLKLTSITTTPTVKDNDTGSCDGDMVTRKYLPPVNNKKCHDNIDNRLSDNINSGFMNEYLKYIMKLNKLIDKDQLLYKDGNLNHLTDREISRKALLLLLDKRDFLKDNIDTFGRYAEIEISISNKKKLEPIKGRVPHVFSNTL